MLKPNQVPSPQKTLTADTLNDQINQALRDALTLMAHFEETGMDVVMKDDYLTLYDIYRRLQEQKQTLGKGSGLGKGVSAGRGQVYFIMIKQLQAPASQKAITADNLSYSDFWCMS